MKRFIPIIIALLSIAVSCGSQKKLEVLRERRLSAQIMLPQSVSPRQLKYSAPAKDSIKVQDFEGREVLIMKAVRDENGEMVATDQIRAAYVSARFRNIAERQGKVELRFELLVPASMQDSKWQLRFIPHLRIMDELKELEPVLITGRQYREKQLRGYEQYGKFLKTIIADTLSFVNLRELEIFIERFMPRLYKFKNDTSFVSDKEFRSCYGVSEKEAIEHYTNGFALRINERRKMRKGAMYRKYVKAPIVTEGLKLDTVLNNSNGDFVYEYVQTIATMPGLRKASIWLDGNIFEQERKLYTIPRSDSLNFYISSLSSLVDPREKYLEKILERQASVHSICWIDFGAGKSAIDETLGKNRSESIRIKRNFEEVLGNGSFELDSIIVTASCSPEGSFRTNSLLSRKRSEAVCSYYQDFIKYYRDSLDRERGVVYDLEGRETFYEHKPVKFIPRHIGENWAVLTKMVEADSSLSAAAKKKYGAILNEENPDLRDEALARLPFYRYLREQLYPRLRTVRFDFMLHRKGMTQDTIHTTVLDSIYMRGLEAIKNKDYRRAVTLLRPYHDYNTALAYSLMDYNASALAILESLPESAQVDYLLAVIHSRNGDERGAVEYYIHAIKQNPDYIHRGNLDPEIYTLIKKYNLNTEI